MDVYRTPDARFEGIPDHPFAPHYVEVDGLRMHTVDEGDRSAAPVLLLHGEPTWSYLYRHMIPVLVAAGHRVVAPDLVGFGRSDKPVHQHDYSYARHVDWMMSFLRALDLRRITLFCQDWGSLIGLRVAAEDETRFDRIVVGNGGLPAGEGGVGSGASRPPTSSALAFLAWRAFSTWSPWFPISRIVDFGSRRPLTAAERRAYDAPFPTRESLAGARIFPRLVPISSGDPAVPANRAAWEVLERWEKPFLTCFSDGDPITRGGDRVFQARVPGAKGQPHWSPRGGHFLQEDAGPEIARRIADFVRDTPVA